MNFKLKLRNERLYFNKLHFRVECALTKKVSSAVTVITLKKEFKVKLSELSKQFDKQLAEAKKSAQAKAMKEVHDAYSKHTKAKDKAVKDALAQVNKTHVVKAKATVKKPSKPTKVATSKKALVKKPTGSKKKAK